MTPPGPAATRAQRGFPRNARRPSPASPVLAHENALADDAARMGEPVRRLRPLLPEQADRRRHATRPCSPTSAAGCSTRKTCRCSDYSHRLSRVKDCVRLTPRNVRRLSWLPPTCGYRLVAEGKDLAWWHPLKSGTRGDGARSRHLGARARGGEREGRARRAAGGFYRQLAGEVAEGGAAQAGAPSDLRGGRGEAAMTASAASQSENHRPARRAGRMEKCHHSRK